MYLNNNVALDLGDELKRILSSYREIMTSEETEQYYKLENEMLNNRWILKEVELTLEFLRYKLEITTNQDDIVELSKLIEEEKEIFSDVQYRYTESEIAWDDMRKEKISFFDFVNELCLTPGEFLKIKCEKVTLFK